MRVVVNIPPGSHPELLKELEKTPPRERAERLRMLATIGIMQLNNSLPEIQKPSSAKTEDLENSSSSYSESLAITSKRQQQLKSKLSF
ncbi:MAG: hypothetical protein CMG93_12745 [Marinomonas sp.]|jgi:hypothetical protein|nr:hypothetical protein [Marinomonas sp.]RUM54355.1 MAG: hypothetical protein DSY85_07450 [Marinomonas sp.]